MLKRLINDQKKEKEIIDDEYSRNPAGNDYDPDQILAEGEIFIKFKYK